jgi:methionyl-tRNA formyltransferase
MNREDVKKLKIAFFGTPEFSVSILNELEKAGILPSLVVTNEDKPKGRKLILTPPPVKDWAVARNIAVIQPKTLRDGTVLADLRKERWDLFIVAAYGKIIPKEIIDLPLHRTLNVHPSLLPKFRGASPIESQILNDEEHVGVSIMILDEEMDHGPVVAQEEIAKKDIGNGDWPARAHDLEKKSAEVGGALLARTIPLWIDRSVEAVEQEHHRATYTKKISKEDGLIDLSADPYQNFLKIRAYEGWPGTYFFVPENIRVVIKDAFYQNGNLVITRVIPEGKKEMSFEEFHRTNQER